MMKIEIAPEDPDFKNLVEIPGDAFLARHPNVTTKQLDNNPLWRLAIPGLRRAYKGVCAYCAIWIPEGVGSSSVDHYKPKHGFPHLTYKWDNLRLVCLYINSVKSTKDVMDPQDVEDNWFKMNLFTYEVELTSNVPQKIRKKVEYTITEVGLNNRRMINLRENWLKLYSKQEITIEGLRKIAPFVARQIDIADKRDLTFVIDCLRNAPDDLN